MQAAEKLILYTIRTLLKGKPPKVTNGERLIDWIYVDGVIEGLLTAGEAIRYQRLGDRCGIKDFKIIREVVEHSVGR